MNTSKWNTPTIRQSWCTTGAYIAMIAQGMMIGYPACLLPVLQAADSPIKLDIDSASSFVSAVGYAGIVGKPGACIFMDYYGRRFGFLMSMIPGIIGWMLFYLAHNYNMLLVGRLLTGIAGTSVNINCVVMLGEYTSPQHRGMFLNIKTASFSLGTMIVHILGKYMHWRTIAFVIMISHVIAFLMACTWPESPSWLAAKEKFEKSRNAFVWLRGEGEIAQLEIDELIEAQKERFARSSRKVGFLRKLVLLLRKLTLKDFLKPLLIATCSVILMETSGRHYFPSYALQIMGDVTNTKFEPYYYTLCVDSIISIGSICAVFLIRILKRRTLLFSTGVAALVVIALLCSYLYLASKGVLSKDHPWIVVTLIVVYFFLTNLACSPMPYTFFGEIFPLEHRESASCIVGIFSGLGLAGILKVTPYLIALVKIQGTFAIYGIASASMLLILYFVLPETKDRTLQEIENYFNFGKFRQNDMKDEDGHLKMISK